MPGTSSEKLLLSSVIKGNSLTPVINYIKKESNKDVTITDHVGWVYHNGDIPEEMGRSYLIIPDIDWRNATTHFIADTGCLYYPIGEEHPEGFIVVGEIEDTESIPKLVGILKQTSLAVWVYYNRLNAVLAVQRNYWDKLINDIVFGNVYSLKGILEKYKDKGIDIDRIYYVCIFVPEPEDIFNIAVLHSFSKDWLRVNKLDIFCSVWQESSIIFLCPSHFHDRSLEVDYGWERHLSNISRYKNDIDKRFRINSSMGVGRKYALADTKKSFQEAKIALSFAKVMGPKYSLRHYHDLGYYQMLFDQDKSVLETFILNTLGPLIEYDKDNDSELITTLRSLFDLDMKWNFAAQNLYIHVNTLRYRVHKINELLNVNLDQLETQVSLLIALRTRDVLEDADIC